MPPLMLPTVEPLPTDCDFPPDKFTVMTVLCKEYSSTRDLFIPTLVMPTQLSVPLAANAAPQKAVEAIVKNINMFFMIFIL